jgi:hypothetical protein
MSSGVEQRMQGTRFPQYKQTGNNLEIAKVTSILVRSSPSLRFLASLFSNLSFMFSGVSRSLGGVTKRSTFRGNPTNRIASGVTGLNGPLPWYSVIFLLCSCYLISGFSYYQVQSFNMNATIFMCRSMSLSSMLEVQRYILLHNWPSEKRDSCNHGGSQGSKVVLKILHSHPGVHLC